jgi:hypothetical protein
MATPEILAALVSGVLVGLSLGDIGGFAGIRIAGRLAVHKRALSVVFICVVAVVGTYVAAKDLIAVTR